MKKNLEYEIKTTFKNDFLFEKLINQINSASKIRPVYSIVKWESVYGDWYPVNGRNNQISANAR
jgi:hypothetical protein